MQELDRVALEVLMPGAIHRAHASGADPLAQDARAEDPPAVVGGQSVHGVSANCGHSTPSAIGPGELQNPISRLIHRRCNTSFALRAAARGCRSIGPASGLGRSRQTVGPRPTSGYPCRVSRILGPRVVAPTR